MRENPLIPAETIKKLATTPLLLPVTRITPIQKQILKGFGLALLKPKLFVLDKRKLEQENETYTLGTEDIGPDKKGGLFGLPIWDSLTVTNPRYETFEGDIIDRVRLTLDVALLEVVQPRNIIKTPIAGRNGTIKEYMSDGDYNIKVRGVLYSQIANRPPKDEVVLFNKLMTAPLALDIECNLLNYIGVYSVVTERFSIHQREGVRNVFDIEIDFLSDYPSELDA